MKKLRRRRKNKWQESDYNRVEKKGRWLERPLFYFVTPTIIKTEESGIIKFGTDP